MRRARAYVEGCCLLMGTWLEILDIPHVILCGDDRFILCADDHISASFACIYAIGRVGETVNLCYHYFSG